MKISSTLSPASLAGLLGLTLLAAGCSNMQEDVRLTLCKDMVISRLGTSQPVTWEGNATELRGYEDASIRVEFSAGGRDGQAVCYYRYNAVEDTALTLSDPLSAYSTSPSKMTLNGQTLSKSELARAVKDAMLKQGRELVDKAKNGFQ